LGLPSWQMKVMRSGHERGAVKPGKREINRKAVENDVEMIIMGSKGDSDDMKAIFFGSTTEKVLRFIKQPVLCIPPECNYNLK